METVDKKVKENKKVVQTLDQTLKQMVEVFVNELKEGGNPFRFSTGRHHNPVTGRFYKPATAWWLSYKAKELGFTSNAWITPTQAKQLKGDFKGQETIMAFHKIPKHLFMKGKKKFYLPGFGSATEAANQHNKSKKTKVKLTMDDYVQLTWPDMPLRLFNLEQIKGIDVKALDIVAVDQGKFCEDFINKANAEEGAIVTYDSEEDIVYCPNNLDDDDRSMLLKTAIEWTSIEGRLGIHNREYEFQQLIACFGASLMAGAMEIESSSSYFTPQLAKKWVEVIEEDEKPFKYLSIALSQAQKAVDYLVAQLEYKKLDMKAA